MSVIVNITNPEDKLLLKAGRYHVLLVGGWKIELGSFSFSVKNTRTGTIYTPDVAFVKVQAFVAGKKSKRIFTLEVPDNGIYSVHYENIDTLLIKPSNLIIGSLLENSVRLNEVQLYFTEKSGFFWPWLK